MSAAHLTVAALLALSSLGIAFGVDVAITSQLRFDAVAAKNRPVSKVTTLLKDMLKQLEKEQETDEDIYDKMACWCTTNDKSKTTAIADAESKIEMLESKIEELTSLSVRLGEEIDQLKEEKAANEQALAKAKEIREKQIAEFQDEEKDLLSSIDALKAAIEVLSKHHRDPEDEGASSLLQMPRSLSHLQRVAVTLQHEMKKHAALLQGVLSPAERRAAQSFIQQPANDGSYSARSGAIFGILEQMSETFQENLATAQKEESQNQKAYEDLKKAKEAEIKAATEAIVKKTELRADTDEKIVEAKSDLEDTKATMSADQKYLANLKEKCAMTDSEWEERQKTRSLEMEAVSKALAVLSSDEAMDKFERTFSLVQKESRVQSSRREQAAKVLWIVGKKFRNHRLSSLAYQVKLDAFTKVKKAIDDMVAELLKEKEDEIKQKDFCVDELHTNELQTDKKERQKADLNAQIEDLEMQIKELTEAIAKLKEEITDLQVELKKAGESRDLENKDFQMTISDQRESQKLLMAALQILEGFYGKKAAMLQNGEDPAGPPPPPGFSEYKKSAAAGGAMSEIQMIIKDAQAMEADAIKAENDAQKAYESFVNDTNESVETKVKSMQNKEETKANKEGELVETNAKKSEVVIELEELAKYNAELHRSCDFVLKNFDLRQAARDEEIQALKQAKAILSGAKFETFLQSV